MIDSLQEIKQHALQNDSESILSNVYDLERVMIPLYNKIPVIQKSLLDYFQEHN